MKTILNAVIAFLLICTVDKAFAQCTGVFAVGQVCGNPSSSAAAPPRGTTSPIIGGQITLKGATSGSVVTKAPAIAGTTTFQYPGSNGVSGQILQSDGSGNTSWGNAVGSAIRQAILTSSVDSNGFANFAAAGAGLNVNLSATATPLIMTLAGGFSAAGPIDFVAQEAADVASFWASLSASQYSFLAIDRNSGTGALTASKTLVRPQRGPVFYAPRQALLHFENNLTDDWGNTWSSVGATFTAPCTKFGSTGLRLSGASSYAQSAQILNPGQGNWTIDVWANLDSNVSANIFSVGNAFGVLVGTTAGGKLQLWLSSGGTAWDIDNGTAGATTVTASAFHHIALTFDGSNYRLFLDGTLQVTTTSSVIVWPDGAAMAVGAQVAVASTTAACFDEFEFLPYAKWVAAFTPPVAASTVSGDWFDTNLMVMKTVASAGPVWTTVQRIYVAEATTDGSSVTAIYNYNAVSQYRGGGFAIQTSNFRMRQGNTVYYMATPQFITNSATIGTVPWVLGPALVPPDAISFTVQMTINHAAIEDSAGVGNQDCTFASRLPTGMVQNYGTLGTAYSNFSGFGAPVPGTAFTEAAGTVMKFPVINGIASLETIIVGTTCNVGGANAAIIKAATLVSYDLP